LTKGQNCFIDLPDKFAARKPMENHHEKNGHEQPQPEPKDFRLYVPDTDHWQASLKTDWNKEYCYSQTPGEDFFHRLVSGEIYLRKGDEKYCLNCAMRLGILSLDRMHWQKGNQ